MPIRKPISLSVEGYRVTPDLIRRVRSGEWLPDALASDGREADALATRGCYQAFQAVKLSLRAILGGAPATDLAERDFPGMVPRNVRSGGPCRNPGCGPDCGLP